MARSRLFDQVRRAFQVASFSEKNGLTASDAMGRLEEQRAALSRRNVLKGAAVVAGAAMATGLSGRAFGQSAGKRIAIIGGGMSGLACADRLRAQGYAATIYEANTRIGGRINSDRTTFPGQVAEVGGELIDNLHKTMLAYANEFNLLKEDLGKAPGAKSFFIDGRHYSEAAVVEEYRQLVQRMRPDMQSISGAPSFATHTAADVALDQVDLATYLATRGAGLPLIQKVLSQAYVAEYGLDPSEQSCLNMLLFLHLDNSSKFREYGVYSDERYHLIGGNDAIATNIR
ncbi:MAG: amine oxidase, partial [Myxococcaceae bacterium]|nr:amine oxidase [Myxococcaceae bacterium]